MSAFCDYREFVVVGYILANTWNTVINPLLLEKCYLFVISQTQRLLTKCNSSHTNFSGISSILFTLHNQVAPWKTLIWMNRSEFEITILDFLWQYLIPHWWNTYTHKHTHTHTHTRRQMGGETDRERDRERDDLIQIW